MPSAVLERRVYLWLGLVAAGAIVLRSLPFLRGLSAFGSPVDYDPGVYFASAALFARGELPYRDFVMVHPPLVLLALFPVARFEDPAVGFFAARLMVCVLGGFSCLLVGRLALTLAGPVAAIAAGLLYASYPEAAVAERAPFIDPFLSFIVLVFANLWIAEQPSARRVFLAGVVGGLAVATKAWAGIWVLASLASLPERDRGRSAGLLLAGGLAGFLIVVAPFFAAAPGPFVEQVVLFHAGRAPDGDPAEGFRLLEIFNWRHGVAAVLGLMGAGLALRTGGRERRFLVVGFALTVLAFLLSQAYWRQYNAHLAVSECVLAGLAFAALLRRGTQWRPGELRGSARFQQVVTIAVLAGGVLLSARQVVMLARSRADEVLALQSVVREAVPGNDCVFAMEPGWLLAASRLPPPGPDGRRVVDTYATMLLDSKRSGAVFASTREAMLSEEAQTTVRAVFASCDWAVLGWREVQLNAETQRQLAERFEPRGGLGLILLGKR